MNFTNFYGNDSLRQRLNQTHAQGKLSHSFLICGPEGSGKHTLARILAAAFQCSAPASQPCGRCNACRKVFSGIHPDVITVDEPDKKSVSVRLIREMQADIAIAPNEGARKIYLLPRGQDLTDEAQNALLKMMEEPPDYAVFLLLTTNPDAQLPTIRSRAAELKLSPLPQAQLTALLHQQFPGKPEEVYQSACLRSGGFLGQAQELMQGDSQLAPQTISFANALAANDPLALLELLAPMEKWKRDQLIPLLSQWQLVLEQALAAQTGLPAGFPICRELAGNCNGSYLLRAVQLIARAREQAEANVGVAHICGALVVLLQQSPHIQ